MTQNEAFRLISLEYKNLLDLGVGGVDEAVFAECWESAGSMRPAMITLLGRRVSAAISNGRERESALTPVCDFIFKFLGYRYIGMSFDIIPMALAGASSPDAGVDMVRIGRSSPFITAKKLEASVLGASGMLYHEPQKFSDL